MGIWFDIVDKKCVWYFLIALLMINCIAVLQLDPYLSHIFFFLKLQVCLLFFGILLGSPLAVAKAAATLPGVHCCSLMEREVEG